jgi:hypothetical protein
MIEHETRTWVFYKKAQKCWYKYLNLDTGLYSRNSSRLTASEDTSQVESIKVSPVLLQKPTLTFAVTGVQIVRFLKNSHLILNFASKKQSSFMGEMNDRFQHVWSVYSCKSECLRGKSNMLLYQKRKRYFLCLLSAQLFFSPQQLASYQTIIS